MIPKKYCCIQIEIWSSWWWSLKSLWIKPLFSEWQSPLLMCFSRQFCPWLWIPICSESLLEKITTITLHIQWLVTSLHEFLVGYYRLFHYVILSLCRMFSSLGWLIWNRKDTSLDTILVFRALLKVSESLQLTKTSYMDWSQLEQRLPWMQSK